MEFYHSFLGALPYQPTAQQEKVAQALSRFIAAPLSLGTFILNGYAGTGKTSLVGALVRTLAAWNIPVVLMAPTGRAAKVFARQARHPAFTIHRRIYNVTASGLSLRTNTSPATVFIVDEASMIGGEANEASGASLLDDLLQYVFSGAEGCKLILLGDTAQLPPVGCELSPAMDLQILRNLGLKASRAVMTQTVRQRNGSGILANATSLRHTMAVTSNPCDLPPISFKTNSDDVVPVEGAELVDTLASVYAESSVDDTIVITRSNRSATQANLAIRNQVFASEEMLVRDERLMVAKNNYFWSRNVRGLDFIANGDMVVVVSIGNIERKWGIEFADVVLRMADRDDLPEIECKVILDTLVSQSAAIDPQIWNEFLIRRSSEFPADISQTELRSRLRDDPWVNALQVKYAYAVTCHKAQGGQWANVFVDASAAMPLPDESPIEVYRWMYTAVTRAVDRLYIINPPED